MIHNHSLRHIVHLRGGHCLRPLAFAVLLGLVPSLLADGPLAPAELPGPLVIVGGGGMPAKIREMFMTLAGKDKAKVIVIPTASEDADDPSQAEDYLKTWRAYKPASVALLHTRDRKLADDAAFVKPLTEATAVWFSGGDQSRLTAAYRDRKSVV